MNGFSLAFCVGFGFLTLVACGEKNQFNGYNSIVAGTDPGDGNDQSNLAGLVPCDAGEWMPAAGTPVDSLYFPSSCKRNYIEPPKPERNLDIIFALDVTGSMGNELSAVRGGIQKLINLISAEKWNLRAGAIAFADAILEEHSASPNLSELLTNMDSSNPNWSAIPGFGGDAPEIGLGAIERAVELLQNADPNNEVEEKIVVYVSDAPAKLLSTHGFDTAHTSARLKDFSANLAQAPSQPSFRFFYSSTTSRKGLIDAMPTPLAQIEKMVQASGSNGIKLPFPLATENLEESFIVPLRKGAFRTEQCALEKIHFLNVATNSTSEFQNTNATKAHVAVPITNWKSGDYKVTFTKKCALTGTREETLSLHLP